jgi:hypothetical protein
MNIDYNRGVQKQVYQGVDVYMYLDDPGVYLNAFGSEVDESLAKNAGYDVEKWGKLRKRKELMLKAKNEIEASLALVENAPRKVVKNVKGFKIVDFGLGRYHVEDPDGSTLTRDPVSREVADKLLLALANPPKEETKPEPEKEKLVSKPDTK